jgi:hypothetical protein
MALLDFQNALGNMVRGSSGCDPLQTATLSTVERGYLASLPEQAAFRFTVKVQRSWCAGRAAKAAFLTLSMLPEATRRRLLNEWTGLGGGTQSFVAAESAAFLEFISRHLENPSHEFTVCMLEMAALRANEGAQHFARPSPLNLDSHQCLLQRGHYAGLVRFHAQPQQLLDALIKKEPLPPMSSSATALLFGPGLDRLYRTASRKEVLFYEKLTSPTPATFLFREGFHRESLQDLLDGGIVEYAR